MITQYAIKQSVTGQAELLMLGNILTGVLKCQVSQAPTVLRVSSPTLSAPSGSQIWIMMTEAPTNLSQYSLTDLGKSLNLSGGSPSLSVTPTAILEGNQ